MLAKTSIKARTEALPKVPTFLPNITLEEGASFQHGKVLLVLLPREEQRGRQASRQCNCTDLPFSAGPVNQLAPFDTASTVSSTMGVSEESSAAMSVDDLLDVKHEADVDGRTAREGASIRLHGSLDGVFDVASGRSDLIGEAHV